jgi:hypothetical protein
MQTATQPQTLYVDAAKKVLEQRLADSAIKVSTVVDFGDPVCVFRPDESGRQYREAVGYFTLTKEQRTKRRFLWDRVNTQYIAAMAVYRDGTLDLFVHDASFNSQGETIARSFEESTGKQTKLYPKQP